jgi:hypothetical protein
LRNQLGLNRSIQSSTEYGAQVLARPRGKTVVLLPFQECFYVFRLEARETMMPEARRQVHSNQLRVAGMRPRADRGSDAFDPAGQIRPHRLPIVAKSRALLHAPQGLRKLVADFPTRGAVIRLGETAAVVPAEIDACHPATV